jgi:arylsulfatase
MTRLNENTVLNVKNRSLTVTAHLTVADEPAQWAVIAQGGSFGGWSLYFRDGVAAYAHNFVGMETTTVRADQPVNAGDVRLRCDGVGIGKGRLDKTVPALFSFDEGLDIGLDSLDPVVDDYATPRGAFNGSIANVVVDIAPEAEHDPDLVVRARYRKQ